jgi:methionine salvage enolase-phosphatase E1
LSASLPPKLITYSPSTQNYVQRAKDILSDMEVIAPGNLHLQAIAGAALKAQQLFFAVSMFRPDSVDLGNFFDGFVRLCARPALVP